MFAIQLLQRDASDVFMVALKNIRNVQQEHEQLLKKLDELAREQADERPLRLIEDMARSPRDMAQMLGLIRRCLAASAFFGHCLAQPTEESEKRLPPGFSLMLIAGFSALSWSVLVSIVVAIGAAF